MADKRRPNDDRARRDDVELNPFPGITGEGAEAKTSFGEPSEGLLGDALDGTLGDASERQREELSRSVGDTRGPRRSRGGTGGMAGDYVPTMPRAGTNSDIAGTTKHGQGAQVGGSRQGGMGADDVGGMGSGTGGGVAVSGGRGSDVGTVGGGMEGDLSAGTTGGMSGGTFGGSRESDVGGGLSGGMRSGMGKDVSGGIGDSDDEPAEGDQQRPRK